MKLALIGGTELRCSPAVLLLLPAAVIFGQLETALILLASLTVHELAHSVMAERLGFPVAAFELWPFGFIARLKRTPDTPSEAAAIAAAGPAVSLLLAFCSAGLLYLFSKTYSANANEALRELSFFNLGLGAVNLLPVLPLDGGRLALSLAQMGSGRRRSRACNVLALLGIAVGLLIAAGGVLMLLFDGSGASLSSVSAAVTGVFIALSAALERCNTALTGARQELAAVSRLMRGGSLRVRAVSMHASCTVRDALRATAGGGYGVVLVLDDDLRTVGLLDEGRLTEAVLSGQTQLSLGKLLVPFPASIKAPGGLPPGF